MSQLLFEKFKHLIEYKSGYTWSKDQENTKKEDGSIRVLTVTNVQKTLDLRSELYLTKVSENDKIEKAVSKDWTIAVSSNGNRSRIGNAIFVENDSAYLFASFLTAFKPKVDFLDPKYFYYWFSSDYVQQSISSVAEGSTGLSNLDIRYLRNMDIKYHNSFDEQKAIAKILSIVDEAIGSTKQTINSAQKLKTSLMQNLLTGKIKPDGTKRNDDEFYYDEKLGKVPNDWEVKTFKEISSLIKRGKSPTYANDLNGIVIINQKCIGWDTINFDEVKYHTIENAPVDRYLLNKDILINSTGTGTIGRVTQFYIQEFDCLADSHVTVLRILDEYDSEFFKYYLMSYSGQKFLESYCFTGSTNQLELSRKYLSKLRVAFPKDKQEQEAISEVLNNMKNNIEYKQNKIAKLENLKKSLMQNLLTGKMRLDEKLIKELISHV